MKMHALKLEELEINEERADAIVNVLRDFLTEGLDFSESRITVLESRRRDGFIPHGHNKGGLEAVAFMAQWNAEQWINGFKNASTTLEKYTRFALDLFALDMNLKVENYAEWTEEQREGFYEYQENDTESTVCFSADLMLTGENELNVRLCVCVKDSPYHRQYDDLMEYNIKFKTAAELRAKLKKLGTKPEVRRFARAVREAY